MDSTLPGGTSPISSAKRSTLLQLPLLGAERYEIAGEFAHGAIGRILRARDLRLSRPVAIKELLSPGGDVETRFVAEAFITARLQHPAIVPVYEAGRWASGEPFFAMKLVSGRSLADVIAETKTLEERLALLPHVIAVAEAIAYAHTERIIHRDLKPANVLVGPFGETVVIDWGLAKDLSQESAEAAGATAAHKDSTLTLTGSVVGTPAYMPPEQAAGRPVDERADVYALGAILYHLLSGTKPYDSGSSDQVLEQVVRGPPDPIGERQQGIPADLLAIVTKAMAREPVDRYATARELAEDLRRFATGQIVRAHEYSRAERVRRFIRRHRAALAVTAVALLALAVVGTVSVRRIMAERDRAERKQAEAELARQQVQERADELTLLHARNAVERDPNAAITWLRSLSEGFTRWSAVRTIAADAQARGFATVLRGHTQTINDVLFIDGGKHLVTASDDYTVGIWDLQGKRLRVLAGHTDEVWQLTLSPDGRQLATSGKDRTFRLWNWETGESRPPANHPGPVDGLAFTPDGKRVVTSCRGDDLLRVWDVATVRVIKTYKTGLGPLGQLALSPDGRHVLVRAMQANLAQLWDLEQGTWYTLVHEGTVRAVAFSPRGDLAATGALDQTVRLWDVKTGKGRILGSQLGQPVWLSFSPEAGRLAIGTAEGQLRLWNLSTGQGQVLGSHEGRINELQFSRDGNLLATSSDDRSARLWDLTTGNSRVLRGHEGSVVPISLSPDGQWLATGAFDHTARIFSVKVEANHVLAKTPASLNSLVVSPDGRHLATVGADGAVRLFDVGSGNSVILENIGLPELEALQFSPDGRSLAAGGKEGRVRLWNVPTGRLARQLEGHAGAITALRFHEDGQRLATGDAQGEVRLWELGSGQGRPLGRHEREVVQLAFSPDGQRLASASGQGEIQLWKVATGEVQLLKGHDEGPRHLIFSPDGLLLISGSMDHTLRIWNLASGECHRVQASGSGIQKAVVSQDGELLIGASIHDSAVRLWSARTGAPMGALLGHQGDILDMALSPDGRRLVTASQDGTVRLWDLATRESRVLRGHTARVTKVVFLDDTHIASIGWDGTARLWLDDLPSDPEALRTWMAAVEGSEGEGLAAH